MSRTKRLPDKETLVVLEEREARCPQVEISEKLRTSQNAVSKLLLCIMKREIVTKTKILGNSCKTKVKLHQTIV